MDLSDENLAVWVSVQRTISSAAIRPKGEQFSISDEIGGEFQIWLPNACRVV